MRYLIRHQRVIKKMGAALFWGLSSFFLFLKNSEAQQIFIDSIFTQQVNANCVVQETPGGTPQFMCPPIPQNVCAGFPSSGGIPQSYSPSTAYSCSPFTDSPSINPDPVVGFGNISNDPHIEFDQTGSTEAAFGSAQCSYLAAQQFSYLPRYTYGPSPPNYYTDQTTQGPSSIPEIPWPSDEASNICNSQIYLCASVGYDLSAAAVSGLPPTMGIDSLSFEVFQYANGSNPLDPTSTPPLRTYFVNNVGEIPPNPGCVYPYVSGGTQSNGASDNCQDLGPFCVPWDGSINLQGVFGKTNGQFGFRAIVQTNETQSLTGNITLTNTAAYPSGATNDADFISCPSTVTAGIPNDSLTFSSGNISLTSVGTSSGEITTGSGISFSVTSTANGPLGTFTGTVISTQSGIEFSASSSSGSFGGQLVCDNAASATCFVGADGSLILTGGNGNSPELDVINGQFALGPYVGQITGTTMNIGAVNSSGTNATIIGGGGLFNSPDSFHGGCVVPQQPITVNVVDVHVVRSSPTLVGKITPVAAQPYNLTYRLSEDSTMYIEISTVDISVSSSIVALPIVDHLVNGLPRVGEGYPGGTLQNGDAWNGRYDNGDMAPPGTYLAYFQASNADQYGEDLSAPYTYPLSIDPLQMTDIAVTPLEGGATSLAVVGYTLTEPATTFMDIYPPGTQFCPNVVIGGQEISAPLSSVNNSLLDVPGVNQSTAPPKNFFATLSTCPAVGSSLSSIIPVSPIQHIVQAQPSRTPVLDFWDGRDNAGNLLGDGNYVYVLYGELASQNGYPFNGNPNDSRIWTSVAKTGFIPVVRGLVGISQITPISSVVGSSPPVFGINPFQFDYTLSRPADVNVDIFNETAPTVVVRHLVLGESRPGGVPITETWNGADDNGDYVSSGTYMVQLQAWDPAFSNFVSTTSALFPADLFRVTNVTVSPLLSGTTAISLINYELSNPMYVGINIYTPGTVIKNVNTDWPPCGQVVQNSIMVFNGPVMTNSTCTDVVNSAGVPVTPFYQIYGIRAGQLLVTDPWAGIDSNGFMVPDGNYPFTLIAQSTVPTEAGGNYATDRIVGVITVARGLIGVPVFNVDPTLAQTFFSSETIELDPFTIQYELTRPSSVTINVLNENSPPQIIRHLIYGEERNGGSMLQDVWDGRDDDGNFPPPAFYTIVMTAEDVASENSNLSLSTSAATVSYWPIQIYDLAVSPINLQSPTARIFYQVSEPMKVAVLIYRPGTQFPGSSFGVVGPPQPPAYTATGAPLSLVKVLVSVQPPRQKVETDWDGTDLTFAKVPDGTYRFTIVGSTDVTAINTITGQTTPGDFQELSIDQYVDDLPVGTNASLNPQGDFEQNTFAYPNPAYGPIVNFSIWVPFQGDLTMKIYTMAGEIVYEHDFGQVAPAYNSNTPLSVSSQTYSNVTGPALIYTWNKVNEAGRPVAKGIYYVVFQAQETYGNKNFVQIVKKVLIP